MTSRSLEVNGVVAPVAETYTDPVLGELQVGSVPLSLREAYEATRAKLEAAQAEPEPGEEPELAKIDQRLELGPQVVGTPAAVRRLPRRTGPPMSSALTLAAGLVLAALARAARR